MSNAAIGNEQVQAPVFCDGGTPDEGESIQQLFEESEVFAGSLVPASHASMVSQPEAVRG
jgi:hypothetical protein